MEWIRVLGIKKGIRGRLIAAFICIGVLPFLLLSGYFAGYIFSVQKERQAKLQGELTTLAAENISAFFYSQMHRVTAYARANYRADMDADAMTAQLTQFLAILWDEKHKNLFTAAYVLDKNGKEVAHVSRVKRATDTDLRDLSEADEFTIPVRDEISYFSLMTNDEYTDEPLIKMAVPMRDLHSGKVMGVFVAEIKIRPIWYEISALSAGEHRIAYIIDHDGFVIAHSNPSVASGKTRFIVSDASAVTKGFLEKKVLQTIAEINYGSHPLRMVIEEPVSIVFGDLYHSITAIAMFFLLALIGAAIVGFFVMRQIVRPVESLALIARKISKGDYSQRAVVIRDDELGDLAKAFNAMTDNLVEAIKNVEHEKDFLRNAIEAISYPFYVIDAKDHSIKLANSAAGHLKEGEICYSDLRSSDDESDHCCLIREVVRTKKPVVMECIRQDAGVTRICEAYSYPIFDEQGNVIQAIEYDIDITERKALEEQLRQAQKLEALGSLAGGIAHDFNNLLTGIIGFAELSLKKLPADSPLYDGIEIIRQSGERGADLTRQLLAFSRKQALEFKVVDLSEIIGDITKIINRIIGDDVTLKTQAASDLWKIKADQGQIDQIIINLAVNARDAMPEGGTLEVAIENVMLGYAFARLHDGFIPGCYVQILVTDNGVGMSSEVKEHIFDPFYTTKGNLGTGLGLATVYGIVKQHEGYIDVESEQGQGTQIALYFPVTNEGVINVGESFPVSAPGGSEIILLVDDDEDVLKLVKEVLTLQGYKVRTALSAEMALKICTESADKIDLLLTDLVMQGMNGRELADKMQLNYPAIKIVFMSGHTYDVLENHSMVEEEGVLISKPIRVESLSSTIRAALDG